jgi:acyl-coenzyme A synthetase/AMP-(fatty) acid ligase
MRPSSSGPDPVDVLVDPDPVGAVLRAHEDGVPIALRTSGTTARPRRVVRSTGSWFDSFATVEQLCGLSSRSRVWVPGPSTGTMNLFARVHATALGTTLSTDPDGATHWVLTPTALASAYDDAREGVVAVVAGDRLDPALRARAQDAGLEVHHYYGAAELSFVAWGSDAEDLRPFPGVAVEERDGVIWVDSPYVADRYDDGDLTRDGRWVTSGDRGSVTSDRVVVHGRDDVVVTGGATVHPADVEAVLGAGVVVVGVPHATMGALVAAVVPSDADLAGLREAARSGLAPAQRPRAWYRLDELPLTAGGKTDRRALAAAVTALPRADRAEP